MGDTGLMAHLLGIDAGSNAPSATMGPLLENFVVMELTKQFGWSNTRPKLFHFREQSGIEIDIILENAKGEVVGIEVKASSTVTTSDFKHLRFLQGKLGNRCVCGVVLYTGNEIVPFGEKLFALPISTIWAETPEAGI
jgi:predicted AAA+ superfamily ATPase